MKHISNDWEWVCRKHTEESVLKILCILNPDDASERDFFSPKKQKFSPSEKLPDLIACLTLLVVSGSLYISPFLHRAYTARDVWGWVKFIGAWNVAKLDSSKSALTLTCVCVRRRKKPDRGSIGRHTNTAVAAATLKFRISETQHTICIRKQY